MTKNSFKTQVGGDKMQSYYALHKLGKENRYSLIKIIPFKYLHQECGISKVKVLALLLTLFQVTSILEENFLKMLDIL